MDEYSRSAMMGMQAEFARKAALENPASGVYKSLMSYVKEFETDLDDEHELGAQLVSFAGIKQFHVTRISYDLPSLITFYGETSEGERVQLIQHISQLSFLLIAMKKVGEKPRRIGFIHDDE